MGTNKRCPDHKVCGFNCDTCAIGNKYNLLVRKIELLNRKIERLEKQNKLLSRNNAAAMQNPPANWWYITFTDKNGDVQPHRRMDPEELKRIGAAVAAGAVCGIIKDKED